MQAVAGDATANIADMTMSVTADGRFRIDVYSRVEEKPDKQ
jgi:hypothetical protein